MPTEALTCPSCGANDSSRGDAHGMHTCVYCNVRYRITAGTPQMLAQAITPAKVRTLVIAGVAGAVMLVGVLVLVMTTAGQSSAPSPPMTVNAPSVATPGGTPPERPSPELSTIPVAVPVIVEAPAIVEAVPEPAARARFEMHHRRPSSGTTFYAAGWVTNESPYPIDRPKITAVLKNEAGVEVGTAFGFAAEVLDANATEAAEILVMNPPAFATIEFEIAARKATYVPPMVEGLRVEPGPIEPASFGNGFNVHGKVTHGGSVAARFVNVRALAFDADGRVLGVDNAYADAEALAPGASARFDLIMKGFSERPTKWEFIVTARPVE